MTSIVALNSCAYAGAPGCWGEDGEDGTGLGGGRGGRGGAPGCPGEGGEGGCGLGGGSVVHGGGWPVIDAASGAAGRVTGDCLRGGGAGGRPGQAGHRG